MRPLALDLVRPRRPARALGALLFGAGALTVGLIALNADEAREELEALRERKALAERRLRAQQVRVAPPTRPSFDEARAMRDANQVIARLNTPWQRILTASAQAAGSEIALTGLNPDTQSRTVRIAGTAGDLAAVGAFIERLQASPGLEHVYLAQHQTGNGPAGTPRLAFVLVCRWGEGT